MSDSKYTLTSDELRTLSEVLNQEDDTRIDSFIESLPVEKMPDLLGRLNDVQHRGIEALQQDC